MVIIYVIPVFLKCVVRRCSVKKVFLEISQNSQENTCAFIKKETLAQVFSCKLCEISKKNFFYRALPVAASKFCQCLCIQGIFVVFIEKLYLTYASKRNNIKLTKFQVDDFIRKKLLVPSE